MWLRTPDTVWSSLYCKKKYFRIYIKLFLRNTGIVFKYFSGDLFQLFEINSVYQFNSTYELYINKFPGNVFNEIDENLFWNEVLQYSINKKFVSYGSTNPQNRNLGKWFKNYLFR